MVQVEPIKAFTDNYIWAIRHTERRQVWVVDPGQSEPVQTYLKAHGATLMGILVTHHHWDHTDGIEVLKTHYPSLTVYGPRDSKFQGITHPMQTGDTLEVFDLTFDVFETPGHTLDHICYVNKKMCFCGDTLFSAGCGRLFEGSAKQMWQSLEKLSNLPDDTLVYCTHEYTSANLAFACAVEPHNENIKNYQTWVTAQRNAHQPTLPSSIGKERTINPFLRTKQSHIIENLPKHLNNEINAPWQVFAALRAWKDEF